MFGYNYSKSYKYCLGIHVIIIQLMIKEHDSMTDSGNEKKENQVDKEAQTISNKFLIMHLSNVTKCSHNIFN